jgi:hypothetical protein
MEDGRLAPSGPKALLTSFSRIVRITLGVLLFG